MDKITLENIARGALQEKFEDELQTVIKNILDPNTEAKKARELHLVLKFAPNSHRTTIGVTCVAKSKLIPTKGIETTLDIGRDNKGNYVASERVGEIAGQSEIDFDTGEIVNETKIIKIANK